MESLADGMCKTRCRVRSANRPCLAKNGAPRINLWTKLETSKAWLSVKAVSFFFLFVSKTVIGLSNAPMIGIWLLLPSRMHGSELFKSRISKPKRLASVSFMQLTTAAESTVAVAVFDDAGNLISNFSACTATMAMGLDGSKASLGSISDVNRGSWCAVRVRTAIRVG